MFRAKPLISDDIRDWVAACFDWFDAHFPPPAGPILPIKAFFSATKGTTDEIAHAVVADVKRHLGYDLHIDLVPFSRVSADYRHSYATLSEAGGTYQEGPNGRLITYDPEMQNRPIQFISTMAHEVMHARLSGLQDQVPGGWAAHELATDLGCVIAGYGVFQLQAADDAGWSGYLSQPTRAHALALFLKDRQLGADTVSGHLSPRCQKLLKRAIKDAAKWAA